MSLEIRPVVDEGLGNSSYVIGLGDGRALVVDPFRDPGPYLALAERRGWRAAFAAETHLHADFVSGSRELAAGGAQILLPARAEVEFPARGLDDGDEVDLGGLRLRALATPGHTPEHLSWLLLDGARPLALFSGGALIVGGIARPDLLGPDQTEPLARAAWRSIRERLFALPDDLAVYPTHGAGSFCSAGDSDARTTTIGRERAGNPLLSARDEDDFVARLLGGLGSYPPYFLELRAVNRAGPRVYGRRRPDLRPLGVETVERAVRDGAELVDVRSGAAFAGGHVPGSLAITLRPQFATWLGWLVGRDRPLVFVAGDDTDRRELVRQCLSVGYEQVVGELDGGVEAWRAAGRPAATLPLLGPGDAGGDGRRLLDVRQAAEWRAAHVPGAVHVELGALSADPAAAPGGPLLVGCGHGERAMTAASLLAREGRQDVAVLDGGPADLAAARGLGLESHG
jgi:glyoxylase-like metal-dependent hydrolase (beta-lactamase superfamily II)/rhodanese-related sulfurtransferase